MRTRGRRVRGGGSAGLFCWCRRRGVGAGFLGHRRQRNVC